MDDRKGYGYPRKQKNRDTTSHALYERELEEEEARLEAKHQLDKSSPFGPRMTAAERQQYDLMMKRRHTNAGSLGDRPTSTTSAHEIAHERHEHQSPSDATAQLETVRSEGPHVTQHPSDYAHEDEPSRASSPGSGDPGPSRSAWLFQQPGLYPQREDPHSSQLRKSAMSDPWDLAEDEEKKQMGVSVRQDKGKGKKPASGRIWWGDQQE